MCNDLEDFSLEYNYLPSSEAEEQLAQAWDTIIALILTISKPKPLAWSVSHARHDPRQVPDFPNSGTTPILEK